MMGLLPASGHCIVDDPGDTPRRLADMLIGEMDIALGRAGIGMTEQATDGVEVEAAHHGVGGQRMAAIVDAHVVEPDEGAQHLPAQAEVGYRAVALPVGKDERAGARECVEDGAGGRRKLDRLRSGLAIGQHRAGAAYPVPPQAGDLGGPRPDEQQQPDGGGLLVFRMVEDEAEAFQLVR